MGTFYEQESGELFSWNATAGKAVPAQTRYADKGIKPGDTPKYPKIAHIENINKRLMELFADFLKDSREEVVLVDAGFDELGEMKWTFGKKDHEKDRSLWESFTGAGLAGWLDNGEFKTLVTAKLKAIDEKKV